MTEQEQKAFDQMREALENIAGDFRSYGLARLYWYKVVSDALIAANAVSEQVGMNGLTESETSASMSVMGLSKPNSECSKVTSEYSEQPRLQWCDQCGEGVTNFCRGKTDKCPYGFGKAVQPQAQGEASTPDAWLVSTGGKVTAVICEDDADAWLQENGAVLGEPENNPYGPYRKRPLFEHPQATEPAGWKLVPVEPTQDMRIAGGDELMPYTTEHSVSAYEQANKSYRAMLAAAPEAP